MKLRKRLKIRYGQFEFPSFDSISHFGKVEASMFHRWFPHLRKSSIGIMDSICDSYCMKRWSFILFLLGMSLLFSNCTNSKHSESRMECMDRCVKEQFVCAIALAPQLDNPVATTTACVSLYVLCYEKCPTATTRSSSTTSSRRSSSSSGSGNRGGSSSSSSSSSSSN